MAEAPTMLAVEPAARSLRWKAPAILAPLASLRLTVVLFVLSMILVFAGTLAQMDAGVWTVVAKYFRSLYVWIPLQTFMGFGRVFLGFSSSWQLPEWIGFPFPGGWTLGALLLVNLLAAHLVRFRLTWNRAGILLTHSGIVLLLVGELITGLYQVEARMTLSAGETVNFVDVSQQFELAFTRTNTDGTQEEVTIPHSRLVRGTIVSDPQLPVDVEVVRYAKHSAVMPARPGSRDAITAAHGQQFAIDFDQREGTGVDVSAGEDIPSAEIRFKTKGTGEELARGIFSVWFYPNISRLATIPPQTLTVDGKNWTVSLRPRREYKPYSLQLLEFRHDKYIGTEIARNYSSLVRVRDAAGNEDRTQLISMNAPLRYEGDSLFQAGVLPGATGTILQVVRNPGRLLPYISCAMVAFGMIIHFIQGLASYFGRRRTGTAHAVFTYRRTMWLTALAGAAYLAFVGRPVSEPAGAMKLSEFGRLPVVHGGRVKPIDTFARVLLQVMSARQEVNVTVGGKSTTLTPVTWLLDVWSSPHMFAGPAATYRIFRIDNAAVLAFLELPARPGSFRYSMEEIAPHYDKLVRAWQRIEQIDKKNRDEFQANLTELGEHLIAYERVVRLREPRVIPPPTSGGEEWATVDAYLTPYQEPFFEAVTDALKKEGKTPEQIGFKGVAEIMGKIDELALEKFMKSNSPAADFMRIVDRYRADDAEGYNQALAKFQAHTQTGVSDSDRWRASFEAAFNRAAPFYQCMALYVLVVVLASLSWLWPDGPLGRVAMGLGICAFVAHTAAILARMYIQNRPPVTNLYSSAVFIGWGAVGVLLLLERLHPFRIALVLAGALGASSLVVAHFLGLGGDTLEMMQAVLDTNFWLATHVTCVTLGYTATFVAGFIGVVYLFTRALVPEHPRLKTLSDMIYGVVCFATLFSFVGTVLGGIWADYSWGRFWGWDPKENGALLIVIWSALILHARWGGLAKAPGIAGLAVLGNIVAAWSWFGTNQLGVGLHAYGSTAGTALALIIFDGAMLFIAALALLPTPTRTAAAAS